MMKNLFSFILKKSTCHLSSSKKLRNTFSFFCMALMSLLFAPALSWSMSLDWSGGYRFEWTEVDRPSLSTPSERKAYGLHQLYLSPKIIAADGINIHTRFDILSSRDPAYQYSQAGEIWGAGLPSTTNPQDATDKDSSRHNASGRQSRSSFMRISQLYLSAEHEHGVFFAGRKPLSFGLGVAYSKGDGLFDHWMNTRDLVGYRFVINNISITPMLGRQYDLDYSQGGNSQDEIVQIEYDNPDSGNLLGVLYEKRVGSQAVNDFPTAVIGRADATAQTTGGFSIQRTSIVLGKSWESFGFKLEGSFLSGSTGIQVTNGNTAKMNGYGIAAELYFPRPQSKWNFTGRMGVATGDDPTTDDYEGFQFDKNYDVAFLLFNHRLGQRDFLTTNLVKDQTAGRTVGNSIDDEAIGNAFYVSPLLKYAWTDKLELGTSITYAQLMTNPTNSRDFNKTLGVEWDLMLGHKVRQNMLWLNQVGFLFPGQAFADGVSNLGTSNTFGFASKIAITF